MNHVDALWDLIDRADWPGKNPGHITWRDVEAWPPGTCDWLQGLGLIREVAAAEVAACSDCLDIHIEKVHYRRQPGGELLASIPCPVSGESRLDPNMLRRWQIDLHAFAATLSRHSLKAPRSREVIQQRCWQLGSAQGKAMFLLRGVLWPDASMTFAESHSFPRGSRLVHLASLSPAFKLGTGEWFPLSQVFNPEELSLDFETIDHSIDPAFKMRRDGRFWSLTFGTHSTIVPDLLGLAYLRMLLAAPGRSFTALELASARSQGGSSGEQLIGDESLPVSDGYSHEEMIDDEYREQIQERISDLAAKKNTRGLSAEEAKEMNNLRQHLTAATDVRGRSRRVPRERERARISATNAISRAIVEVSKALPEMADHLRAHIKTGSFFSYEGNGIVSWSFPEGSVVTSHVTT